jgi:trehalose 6-phosphate phosphatase
MRDFAAREDLVFEAKTHGAALHYRQNTSKGPLARAFVERLADELGWNVQNGKAVSELIAGRSDKGDAVRAFMQKSPFAGARPVFIGDDLTDEHGISACMEQGGCGIMVGDRKVAGAQFRLPDVASVHRWLDL